MNLTQGLHRAVQQHPDAVATVCDGRVRTHAGILDRVARLAAGLQELGVRDGARAAVLAVTRTATWSSSPPRCGPAGWWCR